MTPDPPEVPAGGSCVGDLVAAYVLGACTAAEADVVETHLGHCATCAADAARLLPAALPWSSGTAVTAGPHDLEPPIDGPGSLTDVLTAALAVWPSAPGFDLAPSSGPAGPARGVGAACYGNRVGALDRVLIEMAPDLWSRPAAVGWSVRELILHLYAVDGLLLDALSGHAATDDDPLTRTLAVHDHARDWPIEVVWQRWYERAGRLCTVVNHSGRNPAAWVVTVGPLAAPVNDHLIARAFETWIHTRDVAAAAGLHPPDPGGFDLHAMADLSLRLLASPWAATTAARTGRSTDAALHVTLTGPGGGSWTLDPVGAHEAGVAPGPARPGSGGVLSAGIVEFCLVVGDRLPPSALPRRTAGDDQLAADLLALAPSLSGP
ncbi:conserved hypothetical protein [Frankia canadensis]|uniref:Mycothiol-dependent maleylpyruvate isomerase metal-binding domain-containing protein n=1 Tax=Frankia canadensis TaxID=1836972 RepID=A0A2I2KQ36_9ACTN|nr:maleylpyruvate isomerase N-terminal domain-containing protein [Frankia canadensis]SNQ47781.1 conserved hypothetical protein [Frankia canadensis]SOU55071.1 conserved hypothetical protein [Frankia canadensis]